MTMETQSKEYTYPDGTRQRVQWVQPESWEGLDFLKLPYAREALDCFANVYRSFLVPACPWLFANMILFHIPEDLAVPFPFDTGRYGSVGSPLTAAAAALKMNVRFRKGKPVFQDDRTEAFWQALEARGCIRVVRGRLPVTTPIPVGSAPGYLSRTETDARMKVNASFFIMDRFDCATVYDHIGTVLGLCVKDGVITNPPLYRREALLVKKDGTVLIQMPDIRSMDMEIGGKTYRHGKNASLYTRPQYARTPCRKGTKLVIVGCRVEAVCARLSVPIPASGFVLCIGEGSGISPGDPVTYRGMEDVRFGIQVGNSILRSGEKTQKFISRFYNIYRLQPVPYPPSLYPMNFHKARAARIALGADREGRPMLLWAEGAPKLGYAPGQHSRGASLADMADFCQDAGMVNAVNLDGGGSAQLLLNNRRALTISDRNPDGSEAERPVPLGLIVK